MYYTDYLEHYGVKGMEWGKKKKKAPQDSVVRPRQMSNDITKGLASGAKSSASDTIKNAIESTGAFKKVYTPNSGNPYYYKRKNEPDKEYDSKKMLKLSPKDQKDITDAVLKGIKEGAAIHGRQTTAKLRSNKVYSSGKSAVDKIKEKLSVKLSSIGTKTTSMKKSSNAKSKNTNRGSSLKEKVKKRGVDSHK